MKVWQQPTQFDWDDGNSAKNRSHGLEISEIEEAFLSERKLLAVDYKHNQAESRYILLACNRQSRWLYVVFTMRQDKIRVISARYMHQKEVDRYEKALKNS